MAASANDPKDAVRRIAIIEDLLMCALPSGSLPYRYAQKKMKHFVTPTMTILEP